MVKITKKELEKRIKELESLPRSPEEDFYLSVMKEIHPVIKVREQQNKCAHDWRPDFESLGQSQTCMKCGLGRSF